MAGSPQDPGPSWQPGGNPAPASPPTAPSETGWRELSPPTTRVPTRVKVWRLAGLLAALLGTATALVWFLLWLRPPGPAAVMILAAGYEDNLLVDANPQGAAFAARLARMAGSSSPLSMLFQKSGRLRTIGAGPVSALPPGWEQELLAARENTVVLAVALHGGADTQGPFLFPGGATTAAEDRIRIQSLLDGLAKLPPAKHKVLLLDATGGESRLSQGQFHNDFARAMHSLESRIVEIPNLVVLLSSATDQHSVADADFRLSLFGRHVLDGIAGRADHNRDGRITLADLFAYVAGRVEADAAALRGRRQTPVILPRDEGPSRAAAISMTFRLDEPEPDTHTGDAVGEIASAWKGFYDLYPRREAVRACMPRDWSVYQALLIRYEQLRLAQSPQASAVLAQADEVEERIKLGLLRGMTTATATLATPAVVGYTALAVPEPYPPLEDLWQAAPADRAATAARLKASGGPLAVRNLLVALLRRAAESPRSSLAKAAELAKLLDDPLRPWRPAEAHFLVMLARDLPSAGREMPAALAPRVTRALKLRARAEDIALCVSGDGYAYAERLQPAILPALAEADRERRLGQDRLFSDDPAAWDEADDHFAKSTSGYDRIAALAGTERAALALCARARDEMPVHALITASLDDAKDEWVEKMIDLYGLVRRLEEARRGDAAVRGDLVKRVGLGLDELQARLDSFVRSCETDTVESIDLARFLLAVPWLSEENRAAMVGKLGRLAQRARSTREANVTPPPEGSEEAYARRTAIRRGRLALAALGPERFDAIAPDRDPFADVMPHVRRPSFGGSWHAALAWAGEQVAARRTRIPALIREKLAAAKADPARALAPLDEGDDLVRLIDAGLAQAVGTDPAVVARGHRLGTLLVAQAGRVRADRWYADDPADVPYYRRLGTAILRDAADIDPLRKRDDAFFADAKLALERPDAIRFVPPASPSRLVPGERVAVAASFAADAAPEGYAVAWPATTEALTADKPGRRPLAFVDGKSSATVSVDSPRLADAEQSPPGDARPQKSAVAWNVYYRGQRPVGSSPVLLYPVAESTRVEYLRPRGAALAVRGEGDLVVREGVGVGGIAFVFDCSGSVGAGGNRPPSESERFTKSVAALRKILAVVPPGVRVSLWTFGQAVGAGNSAEKAESTIERLREPSAWEGNAQIDTFASRVETLLPWNKSPVARTILRAKGDLPAPEGANLVVVLSDGDDNCFAADKEGNPKGEGIADAVKKAFGDGKCSLHLVGYAAADKAPEPGLVKNFGFVKDMKPAGTLSTVDDLGPLMRVLARDFRPTLPYTLDDGDPKPHANEVSRPGENDRWLKATGRDEAMPLAVPRLDLSRNVELRAGDAMLLGVYAGNPRVRRLLWSREPAYARAPAQESAGRRVAVVQNQSPGGGDLQMLLAAEKLPDAETVPALGRPAETWLKLEAGLRGDDAPRPAYRWGEVAGFPAPAFGVDAAKWPLTAEGPARPRVALWWAETPESGSVVLRRGTDSASFAGLRGEHVVGKDSIALAAPAVEEHWVQVSPTTREKRWCLVFKASHAAETAAWVRLAGAGEAGQEHRHYLEAGRYVGLFWFALPLNESETRERFLRETTSVRLYSARAMEAAAGHAEFADLDVPAPSPGRPQGVLP